MAEKRPRSAQRPDSAQSLSGKLIAIHEHLAAARVPHALGGDLALSYYSEPQATARVDVYTFVPTERWPYVRDALAPLSIEVDVDVVALERDDLAHLWWDHYPVDLFFSYDPFHDEMKRRARRVPFGGTKIPILAPEHLAVCKAMFDRTKDWLDIEQILVATNPLDLDEIETWLQRMVGANDPRMQKLREIVSRLSLDERP